MTPIDRRTALRWAALPAALPAAGLAQTPKPDPYADGVLVAGGPPPVAPGSFTVAVLPDTQHYSEKHPNTYLAQTRWVAEQKATRNIACVLHLGDITNRNTPAEWANADRAMKVLEAAEVPYFLCPGNHDYGPGGGCQTRDSGLTTAFPAARFRGRPTFGGTYDREPERTDNSFHLFAAGGREFLALCLEFGPRADVVRWANEIADRHPTRQVVLVTHAYMYHDDTRYNWKRYGAKQKWNPHAYPVAKASGDDVTDGQELWDKLLARHHNFALTLNGHVLEDGLGRLTTTAPDGRAIPQVLVNFQMRPAGGDGWLRLLEFKADGKTVDVIDYSPTRRQRNESAQNKFTLTLPPVGRA